MPTGRHSGPGPIETERNKGKSGKGFRFYLGVIVLLGLAIELLLRPFWPELVRGESALSGLVRLGLALLGIDLTL